MRRKQSWFAATIIAPAALLGVSCTGVWAQQPRADAAAEALAQEILQTTGVRGGLVVHLGCGNGRLTAALCASSSFLVHGLDRDAGNVQQARAYVDALKLYGHVSIDRWSGNRLPYAENLVNLMVVEDAAGLSPEEILRVLAPGGVACARTDRGWTKTVKPRPAEIDEWTHYLHGPDNNAVAQDQVVGPPQHFQWIAPPRFSRSHDHLASVSAVVSAGGRIFYIVDHGSIAFAGASPRWRLVARDAFSGIELWQREVSPWEYHLRDFRSGPADLARRLVAVGDRVYVTLGYDQPVVALDAASGKTLRTYAGTEQTQEIICADGKLFLVLGRRDRQWPAETAKQIVTQTDYSPPFERYTPPVRDKYLLALEAETGKLLWRNTAAEARQVMPSTLAVADGRVYFQNTDAVVCLDAATGQLQWQAPRRCHRRRLAWSTPTLVVHGGIVFSADRRAAETEGPILWIPSGGYHEYIRGEEVQGELIAFDARNGQRLWSCPAYEGFNAPVDVLLAAGLLWTGRYAWGNDPGITEGRDPRTGQVVRQRPSDLEVLPRMGHARCHRAKATSQYLLLGRRGVEFIDVATGRVVANRWVRGICQYGVMPANGLLYVPPHSCACEVDDLLKCGFAALAPGQAQAAAASHQPDPLAVQPTTYGAPPRVPAERLAAHAAQGGVAGEQPNRLDRGPAYGAGDASARSDAVTAASDWPTYRHDISRSGSTRESLSADLQLAWQSQLGGRLTAPVVAEGIVLVAGTETHRVFALEAATGRLRWTFVAGARIDSPPTIWQGRAIFGAADGWVYCLRLCDGELVWRFCPAPQDRLIVVDGQLESAWPVSGSVLVLGGAAYFVAGRTSYLDGGMFLCQVDAASGRLLRCEQLAADPQKRDAGFAIGGYLPDVLSSDGDSIFMRRARFDLSLVRQPDDVPHLWSSVGFLDDSWWHRTYWQIGTAMGSGWGAWPNAGQSAPAGRLLVSDAQRVFGYGRNQYDIPGAHVGVDAAEVWGPIGKGLSRWTYYRLFGKPLNGRTDQPPAARAGQQPPAASGWARRVPVLVQAMVLADQTLFIAGPEDPVSEIPQAPAQSDPLAAALESTRGGRLLAVAAADGKTLADKQLASPPVFDGMAAAGGCLYLSTKQGHVVCLGPAQ